jgi:predicted Fe-Mo cluster-binding NifX family protein
MTTAAMTALNSAEQKERTTIRIIGEGPDKSGKGPVIALLAHLFKEHGIECIVQGEYGHNANKMLKVDDDLIARIKDSKIALMGLQTSR